MLRGSALQARFCLVLLYLCVALLGSPIFMRGSAWFCFIWFGFCFSLVLLCLCLVLLGFVWFWFPPLDSVGFYSCLTRRLVPRRLAALTYMLLNINTCPAWITINNQWAGPEFINPEPARPDSLIPGPSGSEPLNLGPAGPESLNQGPAGSEYLNPGPAGPESLNPRPAGSEYLNPCPSGP